MSTTYTLNDLEEAKKNLERWDQKWSNDGSNNPNKYQSGIKRASRRVRTIESELKSKGIVGLTEQEILEQKLDRAFPNAASKEIVEFEGKKYQQRFYPLEHSRSRKTVTEWGKWWQCVSTDTVN